MTATEPVRVTSVTFLVAAPISPRWIAGLTRGFLMGMVFGLPVLVWMAGR